MLFRELCKIFKNIFIIIISLYFTLTFNNFYKMQGQLTSV